MANIFKDLLSSMRFRDEEDDFDEFEEEIVEEPKRSRRNKTESEKVYDDYGKNAPVYTSAPVDFKKERVPKAERIVSSKIVPLRNNPKGLEVCIMKPTNFDDSQVICDMLLSGRATVINLEGFDDKIAQRTMDFISGSVYAINGKLHRISSCIFIVSPDSVDISGDYLDLIKEGGFEPPTFHSQF